MTPTPREYLAVFVGGMAGALARVGLTQAFPTPAGHWPWAIFAVNLAGAAILGYLTAHVRWRGAHPLVRPLVGPGFCGALTTFSTLQLELLDMVRTGHGWLALLYAAASVLGGLAAVAAGRRAGPAGPAPPAGAVEVPR